MQKYKAVEYRFVMFIILSEIIYTLIIVLPWIESTVLGNLYKLTKIDKLILLILLTAFWGILYRRFPNFSRCVIGIWGLFIATMLSSLVVFPKIAVYAQVDSDKTNLFSHHRVMLIVPHQDDDINVFGGILEQYTSYGSEVDVVFVTNGDYLGKRIDRLNEAIACMRNSNVPEDHVYFLGYGDGWKGSSVHIYNMPENNVMTSHSGEVSTYGTPEHPAFHDGTAYTFGNYLADMEAIILQRRPDTIFCIDLDSHNDHRASSLAFEKVMGKILQNYPSYTPTVLKGFAYSTAWDTVDDFYDVNIKSTVCPNGGRMNPSSYYQWSERLRLPVQAKGLSRSILSTSIFAKFRYYKSQWAVEKAVSVCNGDKIFWERPTTSLSYQAAISTTSGNGTVVNDFMLKDYETLFESGEDYGIWVPSSEDSEKRITMELPEAMDIAWIYLYDNPSETNNIEDAVIRLSDGTSIHTGPLDIFGSATKIAVEAKHLKTLSIEILKTSGQYAGLSEIELYETAPQTSFDFVKLMDSQEDFVYDYYMSEDVLPLKLYRHGQAPELTEGAYSVTLDNNSCCAEIKDGEIMVTCPRGQQCIMTISSKDGKLRDSILLKNKFHLISIAQKIEKIQLIGVAYRFIRLYDSFLQHMK